MGANIRFPINTLCCTAMSLLLAGTGFCKEAATGFVGLENDSGVWWFKSPEGKPFLSIGINHVEPLYWQSPNNTAFVSETYGPELFSPDGKFRDGSPVVEKWAHRVAVNLESWGFNTFGFHNPLLDSLHAPGPFYYVVEMDIPIPWGWNMSRSELTRAFKRRPCDVFGDEFAATVEANALEFVKPRADDPLVLGYAYTDGPPWTVADDRDPAALQKLTASEKTLHPWVLAMMSQPAGAKGKQAWVAMMKERYPSPEKAGEPYGCKVASWGELAGTTAWAAIADPAKAKEDSQAFLERMIRRWYEVRKNAIRKYDAHHLILGDKLNMNRDRKFPEQLARSLHLMRDYVDVINIQYYAPFEEQRDTLAFLYKESGKPVLNGDTARDPLWEDAPPSDIAFYAKLGQTYADHVARLFALPYFIGWHHCGYMRGLRRPYVEALKRGDRKAVEFYEKSKHTYREGFVSELEVPIEPLVQPLGLSLRKCEDIHRASGAAQ